MANHFVELRKRTGSTYGDLIYLATDKTLVNGLLNSDGKIEESLFPDYVFGGLRFLGKVGKGTGYVSNGNAGNLAELIDGSGDTLETSTNIETAFSLTELNASNYEKAVGSYFVVQALGFGSVFIKGNTLDGALFDNSTGDDTIGMSNGGWELESGDWIILTGWRDDADVPLFSIINNRYMNATEERAGLLSFEDKIKLNSLSNYDHDTFSVSNVNTDGIEVLDTLGINNEGHVIAASKRSLPNVTSSAPGVMSPSDKQKLDGIDPGANLYGHYERPGGSLSKPAFGGLEILNSLNITDEGHISSLTFQTIQSASTSQKGVAELATADETEAGGDSTRAVTPTGFKTALNRLLSFPIFASQGVADTAADNNDYADGSLAFVEVSV